MTSPSLSLDVSLRPFLSSSPSPHPSHSCHLCAPAQQTHNTATYTITNTGTFFSLISLPNLETLKTFSRTHHFPLTNNDTGIGGGMLPVCPMLDSEIDVVSHLLSESFIQTHFFPPQYATLLALAMMNYLIGRRALFPHVALLVRLYSPDNQPLDDAQLACAAEISFNKHGADVASPMPVPPPDCPYICKMIVKDTLRRRGIGKQLLKTCEDLITKMTYKRYIYLHCRMVDKVPLSMYKKAGYQIIKTESVSAIILREK